MIKYINVKYNDLELIKTTSIKFISLSFIKDNNYNLLVSKDKNCRSFIINKNAFNYNFKIGG